MPGQSDKRRATRGNRPAGRSGPGRSGSGQPSGRARDNRARGATPATTTTAAQPRARLTSRAAILLLIVAVLVVYYASSLQAYLTQRADLEEVRATIAEREQEIDALEREKKRLDDPAYVEQQARGLGFVRPGEKPFVVVRDGEPLDAEGTLGDPDSIDQGEPPAWYDDAWSTVLVAGDPPRKTDPPPRTKITDPEGAPEESDE